MKITAREKRYIAIGAVVIAAVLVFYGFSALLEDSKNISKKVEQKRERLAKQLEIMNRKPYYEKELNLYTLQLQKDMSRLLPGDNPNIAASDLGKIREFRRCERNRNNSENASGREKNRRQADAHQHPN